MKIRFPNDNDPRILLNIYAQYINTPVTFEYALPTVQEFSDRIAEISRFYPYLVCEENNRIIGYAYAHRHMQREAYQWGAELSVYLDQSFHSRGAGKKLYNTLIEILKLQGIRTVYGIVVVPNMKSESLHKTLGFKIAGTCHNAGYKAGKWWDVMWFEKNIAGYDSAPEPIIPIQKLPELQIQEILSSFI